VLLNRRDFLKLAGVGTTGAATGFALAEYSKNPAAKLFPYLVPPEDIIPGVANWYASACMQCSAGCGILVRVMEGRAKKIEGNPLHPVNKGGLCARGQAGLQALYNPDRIKTPLLRTGERGKGEFKEITWEEGISLLSKNLLDLRGNGVPDKLCLLTSPINGHLDSMLEVFMKAYGSPNYLHYALFQYENLRFANKVVLGQYTLPHYDIANTNYLLSFGADFLTSWISPVNHSYSYGHMRQGRDGKRGKLVQIEPRLSLAGANADEWVPVKPGSEGLLALSIAYEIVDGGYYKGEDAQRWKDVLNRYNAKTTAPMTEVPEQRIRSLAREFANARPGLAIGGENVASYENGSANIVAINLLNYLTGNIGKTGGVILIPDWVKKPFNPISVLAQDAENGKIKTLILYNTNPVFTTPSAMKIEQSLNKVPFIVSLSSFNDESTILADLILPTHTYLEDWGDVFADPAPGFSMAAIMQPAVNPLFNTRGVGDIFLTAARDIGGNMQKELPWDNFGVFLQDSWKKIYARHQGAGITEATFKDFWNNLLAKGGWWGQEAKRAKSVRNLSPAEVSANLPSEPARFDGDDKEYPFYLTLYPHSAFKDGTGANLPWLQELPDQMTSVVWGTWVEMNPVTAQGIGVVDGDMLKVESPYGRIHAPVYLYPGQRPDTISIPIGQGHRSYGRYADDRGVNPIELIPYKTDAKTGVIPLNSTRVRVSKSDMPGKLVKLEGATRELGRNIVQTISLEELKKMKS
jgi:menaquinone reductase, molybdopterin-binding-like subunit